LERERSQPWWIGVVGRGVGLSNPFCKRNLWTINMEYGGATFIQQKPVLPFMKVWSDLLNITESNSFTHFS
jgi:hypothetical protein